LDLKELKEILQILDEREIAEFELEEEGLKLRIRKAGANSEGHAVVASMVPAVLPSMASAAVPAAPAPAAVTASGPTAAPGPVLTGAAAAQEEGLHIVTSPIVGTFYRSPDPNSPPFVQIGDRVRVGQQMCIIEAMKMMNAIDADVAGEVARVFPENGQPVQYGEPLFALRT